MGDHLFVLVNRFLYGPIWRVLAVGVSVGLLAGFVAYRLTEGA